MCWIISITHSLIVFLALYAAFLGNHIHQLISIFPNATSLQNMFWSSLDVLQQAWIEEQARRPHPQKLQSLDPIAEKRAKSMEKQLRRCVVTFETICVKIVVE